VGRGVEPARPSRGPQPDGDRRRLLQQGPSRGRPLAVRAGEADRGVGGGTEVGDDPGHRAGGDEHGRGVDHVLARGPAMHRVRRPRRPVAAQREAQLRDEGHDRVTRGRRVGADRGGVDPLGPTRRGDSPRGLGGQGADVRGRAGQGRLGVEQGLQPRRVRHRLAGGTARKHGVEETR